MDECHFFEEVYSRISVDLDRLSRISELLTESTDTRAADAGRALGAIVNDWRYTVGPWGPTDPLAYFQALDRIIERFDDPRTIAKMRRGEDA